MEDFSQYWFDVSLQGVAFVEPVGTEQAVVATFRYVLVNQAFASIVKCPKDQLVGQLTRGLFLNEEDADFSSQLVQVLQTGEARQFYKYGQDDVCLHVTVTRLNRQLMVSLQDVSEPKKSERELQRRLAMESILASISGRLIGVQAADLNACVTEALEQIGSHIGSERAAVVMYSSDQQRGSCAYEWCAPGVVPRKKENQHVPIASFAWLCQQLKTGQLVQLEVGKLPFDAVQERAFFQSMGVHSMIAMPLVQERKTQGFIAFFTFRQTQQWDHNDVALLKTFSTLIATVLERLEKESALKRANHRLEGLHEVDQALLSRRFSDKSPLLTALEYLHFMIPCERISVFHVDEATKLAVAKYQIVEGVSTKNPGQVITDMGFYERFMTHDQLAWFPDLQTDSSGMPPKLDKNLKERGFRALVVIPLFSQRECIGLLMMASSLPYFFTQEDIQIAQELASQLTVVLYQQQLDERLAEYTGQLEQRVNERTREITRLSALHQAILQHAGQAILSTDINGVIQMANQACEKLLGYRVDELIGRVARLEPVPAGEVLPVISYRPAELAGPVSETLLDILSSRGYFHAECLINRQDGSLVPVLMASSVLIDENDVPIGYVGIATDISALKAVESKLQDKNQELNTIFEGAIDLHCIVGIDGQFLRVNRAWDLALGYSRDEVAQLTFVELVEPDERESLLQHLRELTNHHPVYNQLNHFRKKDGTYLALEWNAIRVNDIFYASARDVTERMLAEEALRESERRFREIAENVDEVFWIHSADPFELLYVNSAYERVSGQTSQRLYESIDSFIDVILEEDKPVVREFMAQYKAGQEGQLYCRQKGPDGAIRWLSIRTFVVHDSYGKIVRHIGIANDVTSQKEKELVLRQSLQREQELNQLKSQFVSTASHEFRTPLATIQSSVDLVRFYLGLPSASATKTIEHHLDVIGKEIDQFSALLSNILTIGTIEAGKVKFNPRSLDIVAVCRGIIQTHFGQQRDHRVVEMFVEGESYSVFADEKLIGHVIVNLLSNAFKFSKENPLLRLMFKEKALVIQIVDRGIGIPAADLAALFQAFFRASNSTGVPGTGLGLIIARQFVELHNGYLDIQSEEKKGTTCTITLPVRQLEQGSLVPQDLSFTTSSH